MLFRSPEEWDFAGLAEALQAQFGLDLFHQHPDAAGNGDTLDLKTLGREALLDELRERAERAYKAKEQALGSDLLRYLEKMLLLQVIDHHWKDHLLGLDQLRDGIGLRGYGQKDPLLEYKREGFDMFSAMMQRIQSDALERLFRVQAVKGEMPEPQAAPPPPPPPVRLTLNRGEEPVAPQTAHRAADKVGRNDPCPCGSGKKYKKCHGQ